MHVKVAMKMPSKIFDHANSKIPDVRKFHHAEKI